MLPLFPEGTTKSGTDVLMKEILSNWQVVMKDIKKRKKQQNRPPTFLNTASCSLADGQHNYKLSADPESPYRGPQSSSPATQNSSLDSC